MTEQLNNFKISRRNLLQFGAGIIGTGTLTGWLGSGALAQHVEQGDQTKALTTPSQPNTARSNAAPLVADNHATVSLTPDEALAKLLDGNQRFIAQRRENPNQAIARLAEVAQVQAPFAAILSCADSRVVPEITFDQGIGDIFVARIAGNIAATEEVASEEFAVGVLGVSVLMVLGHERCGAVEAAISRDPLPGVLESLVASIYPAVEASEGEPGDRLTNAIKANVRLQVQRLLTSSVIANAVEAGSLKVVGAYYDLDSGEVSLVA